MNRLAAILGADDVLVDVVGTSKAHVFVQAAAIFERHYRAGSLSMVTESLLARERLSSTGLGHGVGIPHSRIKGLPNAVAAVLRMKGPIEFDSPDNLPVSVLIFLFVPERSNQEHLETLAEAAAMLSDATLRERLKSEGDARAVHAMISAWLPGAAARTR